MGLMWLAWKDFLNLSRFTRILIWDVAFSLTELWVDRWGFFSLESRGILLLAVTNAMSQCCLLETAAYYVPELCLPHGEKQYRRLILPRLHPHPQGQQRQLLQSCSALLALRLLVPQPVSLAPLKPAYSDELALDFVARFSAWESL